MCVALYLLFQLIEDSNKRVLFEACEWVIAVILTQLTFNLRKITEWNCDSTSGLEVEDPVIASDNH